MRLANDYTGPIVATITGRPFVNVVSLPVTNMPQISGTYQGSLNSATQDLSLPAPVQPNIYRWLMTIQGNLSQATAGENLLQVFMGSQILYAENLYIPATPNSSIPARTVAIVASSNYINIYANLSASLSIPLLTGSIDFNILAGE